MRSLLLFFLTYLLPLILLIIPSFFIVFKIGLVSMTLLLTGFHLIFPLVLRQSPSKIPLHLSQIFLEQNTGAYKILWLVSLLIHQNLNTLHQYSTNYTGFQSNNASITNCVFLHTTHFKFSNLPIFTIVFLFHLTLCLQDHLISSVLFIPYVRTSLGKRAFSVIGSTTLELPSTQTPVTRYLFLHSAQNSKHISSS